MRLHKKPVNASLSQIIDEAMAKTSLFLNPEDFPVIDVSLEQIEKRTRKLTDKKVFTECLLKAGNIAYGQDKFKVALRLYHEAYAIARKSYARELEAISLGNQGNALFAMDCENGALEKFELAMNIFKEINNESGLVCIFNYRNRMRILLSQKMKSTSKSIRANRLKIFQALAESPVFQDKMRLSYSKSMSVHYPDSFEQVLDKAKEIGFKHGEAFALSNLAQSRQSQGRLDEALSTASQARLIYKNLGSLPGEANQLRAAGFIYKKSGDPGRAIKNHIGALKLYRRLGHKKYELNQLIEIGHLYEAKSKFAKVIQYFERALILHQDLYDKHNEAFDLHKIGLAYYQLGQKRKSIQYMEKSRDILIKLSKQQNKGSEFL